MIEYILNMLKGALMGAANVIPGVSGGTMALLTGIFEKLINTIKSFDLEAAKLASTFKFRELFGHIDLRFLSAVGIGVITGILTFARILDYLFEYYPTEVWAFFFGLILASVYFVGRKVKYNPARTALFILGTATAVTIAFMQHASENDSFFYLLLCGAVAMCSMILPGLSGSFVLLLMGNYQLVMIDAVNTLNISILFPVAIGAAGGLIAFSRVLSWIFKKFHDAAIALLTGFIFGSLVILWPWKQEITQAFGDKVKVVDYNYYLPELNAETIITTAILIAGVAIIAVIEILAGKQKRA